MESRSMTWCLSPRWNIVRSTPPVLVSPQGKKVKLSHGQCQLLSKAKFRLPDLPDAAEGLFPSRWLREWIAQRIIVPDYLADSERRSREAEVFYSDLLEKFCATVRAEKIYPRVRSGLLAWSGPVLQQQLSTPNFYFPSRPALCLDLLEKTRNSVRICVDCRDPLLTPWENITYGQQVFEKHLGPGFTFFRKICRLLFEQPIRYKSPSVKYLHPAMEYFEKGQKISAYWNLGDYRSKADLWDRCLGVLETVGGDLHRQLKLKDHLGELGKPELLGHTFEKKGPRILKVYTMFDAFDRQALAELLQLENCSENSASIIGILDDLERIGFERSKTIWIATLYLGLNGGGFGGMKIHFSLFHGFSHTMEMGDALSLVSHVIGKLPQSALRLPHELKTTDGRLVKLAPSTLSFGLLPGVGIKKITLYAGFREVRS